MESIRSPTQTMMTTCSNIVETFVYIPYVEASETMIDLLVQKTVGEASEQTIDLLVEKTVFHIFLRIPQSTFPTLPSAV